MTFGMPRALFPVLSLTVYHAGAGGTGALFAAVSAGATVAALAHRLARARAPSGAGRDRGGAGVGRRDRAGGRRSARCGRRWRCWRSRARPTASAPCAARRSTRLVTPDAMRGRMSSVFSLVVTERPAPGRHRVGRGRVARRRRASRSSPGALPACSPPALFVGVFPALARYDSARRRAEALPQAAPSRP